MTIEVSDEVEKQVRAWGLSRSTFDAEAEVKSLKAVLSRQDVVDALADHEVDRFVAAGGSALILCMRYVPHNVFRALKVPRAPLLASSESTDDVEDPEVEALGKLSHDNIPRLFSSVELQPGRTLMLSEYIDDEKELIPFVEHLCRQCEENANENDARRILIVLAKLFLEISQALSYMHEKAGLFHFDVKPANILVSGVSKNRPKAWVIDLGLAKDVKQPEGTLKVKVGFTLKYAHPSLFLPREFKVTRTQAKSSSEVAIDDFDSRYDLFALGRTLQECLKVVRSFFNEDAHRLYEFEFLHMVACLCLDGKGSRVEPVATADSYEFVEDVANDCGLDLFRTHKFVRTLQIGDVLKRLLGLYSISAVIPELDPWYPSTINASDVTFVNLTPRVRRLIVHPMFKRLEKERQLGLLSEVFPTATHTRGNHSLGVYAATCRYISALYHDPENPTCRVLFTPDRIKRTIVAALLHDLGQTAFGHDIEEVNETLFSHSIFSKWLLELATTSEETLGPSFHTILSDIEPNGWDLGANPVDDLVEFLSQKEPNRKQPLDGLLKGVIDGPVDADKLDYIVRDSVDCRVQYGHGLDVDRFLRSLTTKWSQDKRQGGVRVGPLQIAIKAKGKASADAFILARTQLYQSVYWHHTFRAVKAMFLSAAALAVTAQRERLDKPQKAKLTKGSFDEVLQAAYFYHVYCRPLGLEKRDSLIYADSATPFGILSENRLAALRGITEDRTLDFFYQIGEKDSQELIESLVKRNFYKRIWEAPISSLGRSSTDKLSKKLKDASARVKLIDDLEDALYAQLQRAINRGGESAYSFATAPAMTRLESEWRKRATVVVDMPLRAVDSFPTPPDFVSDFGRKYFHSSKLDAEKTNSSTWRDDVATMMKESAYLRIFVSPAIHTLVLRHLDQNALDEVTSSLF
nr:HD domain-containing protein [Rhodoferax sp.]